MIEAGCQDRSEDLVDHYTAIKKLTSVWQNIQFPIFKDDKGIPVLDFGWYTNGDVIRAPIYTSTKETSLWFLYDEKDDLYKEVIFEEIESLIPKNSDDITRFEYQFQFYKEVRNGASKILSKRRILTVLTIKDVVLPDGCQWQAVIMGARNPMNSWDKSDSKVVSEKLAQGLAAELAAI